MVLPRRNTPKRPVITYENVQAEILVHDSRCCAAEPLERRLEFENWTNENHVTLTLVVDRETLDETQQSRSLLQLAL